jgi:hypothetical protein
VTVSPLPVLWLCGAPGTGKSTVAWQVLLDLEGEGVRAGYVDIDQLGMVYPPPDGDPEREGLKVANLEAGIPEYAAAGARVLVVSGVVEPEQVRYFTGLTDRFEVTFCHLTVEESVLRQRLIDRGWSTAEGDEAVEEMRMLRRAGPFAAGLDTTAGTPAELAAECRRIIDPAPAQAPHPLVHPSGPGGDITVVCGPRAVGKSSVSWAMFRQRAAAGQRTCYVDLDQISMLRGGGATDSDRRALRNSTLASLWRTAETRGATTLIANGMVADDDDITGMRDAVDPADVRVIRLSAEPAAIRDRIRRRHAGFPARLAGDDLEGASPEHQDRVFQDALAQERRLSKMRFPTRVIDTTTMTPDEVVHRATTPDSSDGARPDLA